MTDENLEPITLELEEENKTTKIIIIVAVAVVLCICICLCVLILMPRLLGPFVGDVMSDVIDDSVCPEITSEFLSAPTGQTLSIVRMERIVNSEVKNGQCLRYRAIEG